MSTTYLEVHRARKTRGGASQRLQRRIDRLEKEYPADTAKRLRQTIKGLAIIDRLQGHSNGRIDASEKGRGQYQRPKSREVVPELSHCSIDSL